MQADAAMTDGHRDDDDVLLRHAEIAEQLDRLADTRSHKFWTSTPQNNWISERTNQHDTERCDHDDDAGTAPERFIDDAINGDACQRPARISHRQSEID